MYIAKRAGLSLHLNSTRSPQFLTALCVSPESINQSGTRAAPAVPCPEAADAAGTKDCSGEPWPGGRRRQAETTAGHLV